MDDAEKSLRRAKKAIDEVGVPATATCSSTRATCRRDASIEKFFAAAKDQFGTIDFLVHSLAFANKDYLKKEHGSSRRRRARCTSRPSTSAPTA